MPKSGLHSGLFRLLVKPDGSVVVPDLTEPILSILESLGQAGQMKKFGREPCAVRKPNLLKAKQQIAVVPSGRVTVETDAHLWRLHDEMLAGSTLPGGNVSLLDVKVEVGLRLLRRCELCTRRCRVDRTQGGIGFCGLTRDVSVSGHAMIYNEGPFVGQPSFAVYLNGCSLRCGFCYRPSTWHPPALEAIDVHTLARLLDRAADDGATAWHFLGGNPDQSLVGILEALSLTRHSLPVVWNSALTLNTKALRLLLGVVDVWIPDFKFGRDSCAITVGGVPEYVATVRRNLLAIRDQPFVAVRHMRQPGHEECCERPVTSWVQENLPHARLSLLDMHHHAAETECAGTASK